MLYRRIRVLACCGALVLGIASRAAGQAIRGVVLDDQNLSAVPTATVRLVTDDDKLGSAAETDALGQFFLNLPSDGSYRLEVSRPGYRTARSQGLYVAQHDTVSVQFRLAPKAVILDPIVVTAHSTRGRSLFNQRRTDWGKGIFFTPSQIDSMHLMAPADVFRKMKKVRLSWDFGDRADGSRGPIPSVVSQMGTGCIMYMINGVWVQPPVWAKGKAVHYASPEQGAAAESKADWTSYQLGNLSPNDIAAVEVYRSIAEVPPKLRRFTHVFPLGNCGLVVFWTKSAW